MTAKTKKGIYIAVIIISVIGIYFLLKSNKPLGESLKGINPIKKLTGSSGPELKGDLDKQLKLNTKGQEVASLQEILNYKYGTSLSVDGDLGPKTFAALTSNNIRLPITLNELKDFI